MAADGKDFRKIETSPEAEAGRGGSTRDGQNQDEQNLGGHIQGGQHHDRHDHHEQDQNQPETLTRRAFVGTAAMAGASLVSAANAFGQSRKEALAGRTDDYGSDPGPENQVLLAVNPDSNQPPFTDKGNPPPFWYSFDLTAKRLQGGGWTHQVTEREIPQSKDLAGVNMRLTAGSFRELHWHLADEWAIMLAGKARVSVMQPDGRMFIDDVERGDLWYFPAGYVPSMAGHYIENTGTEDVIFLEMFRTPKYESISVNEWISRMPDRMAQAHLKLPLSTIRKIPSTQLVVLPK